MARTGLRSWWRSFQKRRGYDITSHLPELWQGGTLAAEKVRHDWGVTLTELVNENYLTQINDWAKAHGTRFRSQTYGEPAVTFSSQNLAGLPEGEGRSGGRSARCGGRVARTMCSATM